eukprot:1157305-Pelagomonas_calceolata.AAC.7
MEYGRFAHKPACSHVLQSAYWSTDAIGLHGKTSDCYQRLLLAIECTVRSGTDYIQRSTSVRGGVSFLRLVEADSHFRLNIAHMSSTGESARLPCACQRAAKEDNHKGLVRLPGLLLVRNHKGLISPTLMILLNCLVFYWYGCSVQASLLPPSHFTNYAIPGTSCLTPELSSCVHAFLTLELTS